MGGRCTRGDVCAFSHDAVPNAADEDSDPEIAEIKAAIDAQEKRNNDDIAMMGALEKEAEADAEADSAALRQRSDSGDKDSGDALPPPATEAEVEEARQIVFKAQREAAEREKMKAKAKT